MKPVEATIAPGLLRSTSVSQKPIFEGANSRPSSSHHGSHLFSFRSIQNLYTSLRMYEAPPKSEFSTYSGILSYQSEP